MDIVFVRHGISELNNSGCYVGSTDCDITGEGLVQAGEAGDILQGIDFDGVYVSPLKRAVQTAVILGRDFKLDNRLREMNFGVFEGLKFKEIEGKYPEYLWEWNRDYMKYKIPGGESLEEVFERVGSFLNDIRGKHKKALLVTHGGIIRCALSLAASNRELFYKFQVNHGSISVISFDGDYSFIKALNFRRGFEL